MYGRYTELSKFARQFAASQRESTVSGRQKSTLGIEEAKRRKNKGWSKFLMLFLMCMYLETYPLHIHTHTHHLSHSLPRAGLWNWLSTQVFPYIIDWMFVLILGLLMALLSFAIDYLIDNINLGQSQTLSFSECTTTRLYHGSVDCW